MNPLAIQDQRPENIAELVEAYIHASGVITQKSLSTEILRVPYPPTYNTKFILKRFQWHSDLIGEMAETEHARSAFDSWMPGSHIVPDTYWESGSPPMIAMEYIPGKNGSEVDMGLWNGRQRRGFVRQMAVIGICLIWKAQDRTSRATTKEMVGRGLRDKSAAAYEIEEIDRFFNDTQLGFIAPRTPSLRNFRFLRPCDVTIRGSRIVAITSWEGTPDRWGREISRSIEGLSGVTNFDRAASPRCGALEGADWAIIREYGGGIGEDDFQEERFENESDEHDSGGEGQKLAEDWYHEPVWQLVFECVYRREIRADRMPIGEYLRWTKGDPGEGFPDSGSWAGYGKRY
ncbi:hypothetical protein HOY82DRAFT_594071 [Tuber indicum]|nr:hypothetical protein HOY82DRAFT_594071 [Tuber indicum]